MAINGKVLVTYFSASKGKVTERLAKLFSAFSDDEELIEWVGALSLS